MAYIRYNPNDPKDRESAFRDYFLGLIFLWGSIGGIVYYICSFVSLFKGNYSANVLYSSGLLVIVAIIDFLILFSKDDRDSKVESAKSFFLFFIGGAIDLAGFIAVIVAISSLCHKGTGTLLLICSVVGILIVTLLVVVIYRKIEGCSPFATRFLTDRDLSFQIRKTALQDKNSIVERCSCEHILDSRYIYCHRCGNRLPEDSEFCSSCGAKLK